MASFKETFKLERDKKGPGKTFTWTDKNGKTETYSTDYAEEKKSAPPTKPKAKPAPTKPKARPANLNPQSGAAQSGTVGKVKPKTKPSGFKDKFNDPDSGYRYEHLPDKRNSTATMQKVSGASRSTAGKVAPKMSQTERAMAEAKAAKAAKDAKAKSKKTVAPAATSARPKALTPFQRLGNIVAGGGFSNYLKKK